MSHTPPADCLLCKVVRGDLRIEKIIETDRIIGVINDIEPLSRGHCVFFPKRHTPAFHDVDDQDLSEILLVIRKVASAMELENYNILQNNGSLASQTVFHAHFHLIPKWSEADGLRFSHETLRNLDQTEISRKIRERLA